MNNKLFTIQETANIMGVSTKTLRRWDQRGRFVATRTVGNQRRYTQSQIDEFKNLSNAAEPTKVIHSLPSVLRNLPSNSFLKNHFLLKHKDEIELSTLKARGPVETTPATRVSLGSQASSFASLVRSSRANPRASLNSQGVNPFKMGLIFASFVLLFSFALSLVLTSYVGVAGLNDKKNQILSFINNLPLLGPAQPDFGGQAQILPFVPQDTSQAVLAAATGGSDLVLNINIPGIFAESATFLKNVGIGVTTPDESAILDLKSEEKGFLAPRMTEAQVKAIASPATSLFVYNTTTNQYNMYNGKSWQGVFTAIGDSTTGEAFTETGTSGTALYFYDADGRGKLTIANLSGVRTYTLPDASGEVSLLGQSISNSELVNTKVTVSAGTNMTGGGEVSLGSSVTLTLKDSISLAGTLTAAGTTTLNGIANIGDNGDNVVIDSNVWDITGAGAASGLTGLSSSGTITFSAFTSNGGPLYTNGSGVLTQTTAGTSSQCLLGGTTPVFGSCASGGADVFWNQSSGALYSNNSTVDLLIGAQATSSAKFAVLNIATGTPTASISANSGNIATYLTGDGTLATTNRQTLTIGNSSTYNTTGNILLNPNGTGNVGIGTATPVAGGGLTIAPAARTSGTPSLLTITGPADTTLAASTEAIDVNFNLARTVEFATGALSLQRAVLIQAPTYRFVGASTLTDTASLLITGPPISGANATINTSHGLFIATGSVDNGPGSVTNAIGLSVRAPTNGANNYAAIFTPNPNSTGGVGIGTAAPGAILDLDRADFTGNVESITFRSSALTQTITAAVTNIRFNQFLANTITAATAQTVTNASTLYIDAATTAAGSASITNNYALWVDAGTSRFDGQILGELGTAGAPEYSFQSGGTADADTGIWSPAANTVAFSTGGTEAFRINSSQQVGIGNTTPLTALDVTGSASLSANLSLRGSGTAHTVNILDNGNLNYTRSIGGDAAVSSTLYLQNDGNVGIGTTSPGRTLDVVGNWGGNNVNDVATVSSDTTRTVSTAGLAYFLSSDSTTTEANVTTTFNITGLPDTNGTFAFIHSRAIKGVTASAFFSRAAVRINGTQVSVISTSTQTAASTVIENYTIVRTNGTWRVTGATASSDSADLAEWIAFTGERPEAGEVLTIGDEPVSVKKSTVPYDSKLIGVVSTEPYTTMGLETENSVRLALAGRVPVKVSLENGEIKRGDYLTSSSAPGVAMKATRAGQVIGKALESFSQGGIGKIMVFVNLSWYDPDVYITSTGDFVIKNDPTNPNPFILENPFGEAVNKVGVFGEMISAIIRAGDIHAEALTTNSLAISTGSLSIAGQNINDYIASILASQAASQGETLQVQIASSSAQTNFVLENDALFQGLQDTVSALELKLNLLSQKVDEVASMSAFLAEIQNGQVLGVSTSSAVLVKSLGDVELNNATIAEDLMVLGRATVTDLGVTGTINAGLLAIHGLDGEINTLSGDLYLQKDSLGGINIFDGKIVMDPKGNLTAAGTISANAISANNYTVLGQQSIGSATIPAGAASVEISTSVASESSKIFLTSTSLTDKQITVVEKSDGKFKVAIPQPTTSPISFDWWIVGNR